MPGYCVRSLIVALLALPPLLGSIGTPGPAAWPGHVAATSDLLRAADHISTKLNAAVTNGTVTTIVVASATGIVTSQVLLINDLAALEEVKVTGISGTTLTVTRGVAGTSGAAHAVNVPVIGGIGAVYHNQIVAELIAFETDRFGHIGSTIGATASTGHGVTSWPFHPGTITDLLVASDFAATSLSAPLDAGSLSASVRNGLAFVANQVITVEREQMKVCSVGSTSLTICSSGRGYAGTTAAVHAANAPVRGLISATTFRRLAAELSALEADLFADYGTGGTATDLAWPNHAATTVELLGSCTAQVAAACYNHMANELISLETSVHAGPVVHTASVVAYSLPSRLSTSSTYSVTVNGTSVPVKSWRSKHWAWFAYAGNPTVTVTVSGGVSSYNLSPHRIAPASSSSGSNITFALGSSPEKLVLTANGGQPLFILADPIETGVPASSGTGIYNVVTGYGADSSGSGQSTDAIQNAMNAASSAGGGTVYVPTGTYKIGPTASRGVQSLVPKANVTVYLAPGAVLQVPPSVGCCFHDSAVVAADDVSNFSIRGRGVIDGNGNSQPGGFFRLLVTENASNFSLTDLVFLESNSTGIRLQGNGINFQNVKVLTDPGALADGTDIESTSNLTVDHSLILSTDDSFAIGSGTDERTTVLPMSNIKLTHDLLWNLMTGHSLSIVPHISNSSSKVDTVLFDSNDTIDTDEWIAIFPFGGTRVLNVTISNSSVESIRSRPFAIEQVDCTSWGPGNCGTPAGVLGYVHGVTLQNVDWSGFGSQNSRLIAFSSSSDIEHVHVTNLKIGGSTITSAGAMHLDLTNTSFIIDLSFAP